MSNRNYYYNGAYTLPDALIFGPFGRRDSPLHAGAEGKQVTPKKTFKRACEHPPLVFSIYRCGCWANSEMGPVVLEMFLKKL